MSSTTDQHNIHEFIGYFEEPEPGVPRGCTGWYHSGGKFPVRTPDQVFMICDQRRSMLREDVAGPFSCQRAALVHLEETLTN